MNASPLTAVLTAFGSGASSLAEVAHRTGLDRDVVDASVEHLIRIGMIQASTLSSGCPDGGCGSCASGAGDAEAPVPGCGSAGSTAERRGPVLVALTLARPSGIGPGACR